MTSHPAPKLCAIIPVFPSFQVFDGGFHGEHCSDNDDDDDDPAAAAAIPTTNPPSEALSRAHTFTRAERNSATTTTKNYCCFFFLVSSTYCEPTGWLVVTSKWNGHLNVVSENQFLKSSPYDNFFFQLILQKLI